MKKNVEVYKLVDIEGACESVLHGSINDLRTFAKDRFYLVKGVMGFDEEESYYMYLDESDSNVLFVLGNLGYKAIELCKIPIEDFEL